ncbi:hypothetical protein Pcinc_017990 [Petrolisthes cinctipes]|uniref:LEM domain-containing protein n=1 Tax=Petrolisthes cinctipes TaxID=88211 RepID=A0AAE1FN47_PETCI|nr:hypothetical protein Pcinc_017990 [Petrolisthes cinctipes]
MGEPKLNVDEICHLTDDELKEAYIKLGMTPGPITATTRHVIEEQLKKMLNGVSEEYATEKVGPEGQIGEKDGPSLLNEKAQRVFSDDSSTASEIDVYFGIFLPEGLDIPVEDDFKNVYTDKSECLAALKKYRGSRFKAFRSRADALIFAQSGPVPPIHHNHQEDTTSQLHPSTIPLMNAEKPSPFRGPKSQDLVKFRKAIEKDDMNYFIKCIEENPRYLVSGGDTPSILQEGFRYNALHVACRTNRPAFLEKVLATVGQVAFFQKLYPDDTAETSGRRSMYLLDLYLNTPDKGLNETPVHFASKHGCVECVRILTSYPACDKLRDNKFAQKPIDIVCSRMKGNTTSDVNDAIVQLLGDQLFVPLLRDDDSYLLPRVGQPCSPQFLSPTRTTSPPLSFSPLSPAATLSPASPISPLLKVRGYAGPMSPTQAEAFHRLWRSSAAPSSPHSRYPRSPRVASLRIMDHEKGLERLGRDLAVEKGVAWREYWDFLGEFTNLASEEGLKKFEAYLRKKFTQVMKKKEFDSENLVERFTAEEINASNTEESPIPTPGLRIEGGMSAVNVSGVSGASCSTMEDLCQDLEALRLNTSLSPQLDLPPAQSVPNASSKFLASLRARKDDVISEWQKIKEDKKPVEEAEVETEAEKLEQQLLYILKSVEVASCRLADGLTELTHDLQSNTVAALSLPKTLCTKLKPEVVCLKGVVTRCFHEFCQFPQVTDNTGKEPWASIHSSVGTPQQLPRSDNKKSSCHSTVATSLEFDFSFIHHLLALKAARQLQKNLVPGDICILAETLKTFVAHLNFVYLDSSDEEESSDVRQSEIISEKKNNAQHFTCVLKCLEQALNFMQGNDNVKPNPGLNFNAQDRNDESDVDVNKTTQCNDSSQSEENQSKTAQSKSYTLSDHDSNSTSQKSSLDLNRNNLTNLMLFGECNCPWRTSLIWDVSNLEKRNDTPRPKYTKAFNFLHQRLFSEPKSNGSVRNCNRFDVMDVVRKLSFEDEDYNGIPTPGKLKVGENVIMKGRLGISNRVSTPGEVLKSNEENDEHQKSGVSEDEVDGSQKRTVDLSENRVDGDSEKVDAVDNEEGTISESENDDNDSFATAASSVEDDMATPEEGVKIYVNGEMASKMDVDVLTALANQKVDEARYPFVSQWHHLVTSHSIDERNNWASPYSCRSRPILMTQRNAAETYTSSPSSCTHLPTAATPRVLFPSCN